jgi:hypothetical protein
MFPANINVITDTVMPISIIHKLIPPPDILYVKIEATVKTKPPRNIENSINITQILISLSFFALPKEIIHINGAKMSVKANLVKTRFMNMAQKTAKMPPKTEEIKILNFDGLR